MKDIVAHTTVYTLVDLGEFDAEPLPLTGLWSAEGSVAKDLNNTMLVVGHASDALGRVRGFRWQPSVSSLDSLGPSSLSVAYGVNELGDVVGAFGVGEPALWPVSGAALSLGSLGGDHGVALSINNAGMVVGYSATDTALSGTEHAFLWGDMTGMVDLGTLSGGDMSRAQDINASGVIVGVATTSSGDLRAVRWPIGSGIEDLGTLGGPNSEAIALNSDGEIVGCADVSSASGHAVKWSGASILDLGALPGGSNSAAHDINEVGAIVGYSDTDPAAPDSGLNHATLWDGTGIHDLNEMVEGGTGWTLLEATAINDLGQIVGFGLSPDTTVHGYLLVPGSKTSTGQPAEKPRVVRLYSNHPNPFSRSTTIRFDLPRSAKATVSIFDIRGRVIRTLASARPLSPGRHEIVWDGVTAHGRAASPGIYLYVLRLDQRSWAKRLVLLK